MKSATLKVLIITSLTKATERFAEENGYTKAKAAAKSSERATKVAAIIDRADFGCKRENVAALMEAALGEPIPYTKKLDGLTFKKLAVVVPTLNTNGHNYPLDKPCIITRNDCGLARRLDGSTGNNLPPDRASIRPATKDEITTAANALVENLATWLL